MNTATVRPALKLLAAFLALGGIGVFSSGIFGGIGGRGGATPPAAFNAEEQVPGFLTDAKAYAHVKPFYISVGEQDPRIEATRKTVADFRAKGHQVEFAAFPGGHEWQVWRKSLHDFAPRLFR